MQNLLGMWSQAEISLTHWLSSLTFCSVSPALTCLAHSISRSTSSISSSLHLVHSSSTLSLSLMCLLLPPFLLYTLLKYEFIDEFSWQVVAPWCRDEANERQLPRCRTQLMGFYRRSSPADAAALLLQHAGEWGEEHGKSKPQVNFSVCSWS